MGSEYCAVPVCGLPEYLIKMLYLRTEQYFIFIEQHAKALSVYVSEIVSLIFPIFIIPLGTIANILSIMVFSQPSFKKSSLSFLMKILAITDMLGLHTVAWNMLIHGITDLFLPAKSDFGCKLYIYFSDTFGSYSGWVLSVITEERMIAVVFPHKAKVMCTKRNIKRVLILILAFVCITLMVNWLLDITSEVSIIFKETDRFQAKQVCNPGFTWDGKKRHFEIFLFVSKLLIHSVLPFFMIFLGNIIIIITLMKNKDMQENLGKTSDEIIFLRKLPFITSLMYIALTLSNDIYMITVLTKPYENDDQYVGAMNVWFTISQCLICINNSINLFLYCMVGKTFRNQFKFMLT